MIKRVFLKLLLVALAVAFLVGLVKYVIIPLINYIPPIFMWRMNETEGALIFIAIGFLCSVVLVLIAIFLMRPRRRIVPGDKGTVSEV
jgi:uncharacterized BrkB/YihY/UPF0761 family membrane protein